MSKELKTMSLWHEYSANGGRADFEVFYAHTMDNQKLLVKVSKWANILRGNKAQA